MINIIKKIDSAALRSSHGLIKSICEAAKRSGIQFEVNSLCLEGIELDCSVFILGNNNYIENVKLVNGPIVFSEHSNRESNHIVSQ